MQLTLSSCSASRQGNSHDENEDAWLADDARGLYVVSDGVGSYRGAGEASRIVIVAADEVFATSGDTKELPKQTVKEACARLNRAGAEEREYASMTATITLLAIAEGVAYWAHIGDTRAYLLREKKLSQITRDHTLAWEQFEMGAITKDAIRNHPNQRLHTRILSASKKFALPETGSFEVRPGDLLLLCSDGVNKALDDDGLAAFLAEDRPIEVAAPALVEAVLAAGGGGDDITAVLVRVAG